MEETKSNEVIKGQLKEKEDIFQEREFEIVTLQKELEKTTTTNFKFEKSTLILYDIIIQQISPLDKTSLGYDEWKNVEEGESSKPPTKKVGCSRRNEDKSKSDVEILRSSHQGRDYKGMIHQQGSKKDEYRDVAPSRRYSTPRYLSIFLGIFSLAITLGTRLEIAKLMKEMLKQMECLPSNYNVECYKCCSYGHMEINCRIMMNHNVECYKCHDYGHMERD